MAKREFQLTNEKNGGVEGGKKIINTILKFPSDLILGGKY